MSHFNCTIAISGAVTSRGLPEALDAALAPYNENMDVPEYVDMTPETIRADERFQKYWMEHYGGEEGSYRDAASSWFGADLDADGNSLSTYNPKSQWDWWVVGGRWGGFWIVKEGTDAFDIGMDTQASAFGMAANSGSTNHVDAARLRAIEPESLRPTFAFIDLDGDWNESGKMLWFGVSKDNKDEADWASEYADWIRSLPADTWLINCDLHI